MPLGNKKYDFEHILNIVLDNILKIIIENILH